MAASDNNLEIRITGEVDPSLPGATAAASQQLNSLAATGRISSAELRSMFGGALPEGAKNFNAALLQAANGEREVGAAASEGIGAAVAVEREATAATTGLRIATSGAIQEYIRLGHEALTGNFSRMPGSLVVLTSRMGGLTSATLGTVAAIGAMGAAIVGPLIGMAYLALKQAEAEREAKSLAEGFQLTGRGAEYSAEAVAAEVDRLSEMQGVSESAAQALVRFDATHADLNSSLAIAANQLMPAYVTAFGDKAPQALNALKTKLIEISTGPVPQSIRAFEALNKTSLNLPRAAVPAIEQMIRSGNGLGAALQIVLDQAQGVHVPIENLGAIIKQTSADIDQQNRDLAALHDAMRTAGDGASVYASQIAIADDKVRNLTASLHLLQAIQAATAAPAAPKTPDFDSYLAGLRIAANLAHEGALQQRVDNALIAEANNLLRDQGRAEDHFVTSAKEARQVLGAQADEVAKTAAAGFVAPKGPSGAKAVNDARRIGEELAQAYAQANDKRIEGEEQTNEFLLRMGQESLDQFIAQARKLENERYEIELEGNRRRQQADKNDPVALQKDLAEEQIIEQEHANRMAAIERELAEKKKQIQETALQDFIKSEDAQLNIAIERIGSEYEQHRISAQQKHDLEQAFTLFIETQVLKRFDAEHAGLTKNTEAYEKYLKDRQALTAQFDKRIQQQNDALANEEAQKWHTLADSIRSSFNSALSDLIFHGGTLKQFMTSVAEGIAEAFLQMGEKIAEDWLQNQLMEMFEAKTTQSASAISQITDAAAIAGANTFASISAIPVVGPELAPAAAAGAVNAVMAFSSLVVAEGGLERVPGAVQPALLHRDESVLPANVARPLMTLAHDTPLITQMAALAVRPIPRIGDSAGANKFDGSIGGGLAASIGSASGATNVYFQGPLMSISALDGADVQSVFSRNENRRALEKIFRQAARAGIKPRKT